MQRAKLVLTASAWLAYAIPVYASQWLQVGAAPGLTVDVDQESIRFSKGKMRMWVRFAYSTAQQLPNGGGKTYQISKQLETFNCVDHTAAVLQKAYYSTDDGEFLGQSSVADTPAEYFEPIPDSIGDVLLKLACEPTPKVKPGK